MISLVIPTFNRRQVLTRAIDSILRQTVSDFEILVVDDGGTDDTEEFIKNHYPDSRIRYERLPQNTGVHAARNRGLELAKGEFIEFLDSDDELLPDAFQAAIDTFHEHPDVGMVSAPFRIGATNELSGYRQAESGYIAFEDTLCERILNKEKNGFVMSRKTAIGDSRFAMQNLDFIFYRRVAKRTKNYFLATPLGIYHLDRNQSSLHLLRNKPNPELSIKRGRALLEFINEFRGDLLVHCPKKLGSYAYGAAVGLLLAKERHKAIELSRLAASVDPRSSYRLYAFFTKIPASSYLLIALFRLKGLLWKILKNR